MIGIDPKAFQFKKFSIYHHPEVMRVSTDSVILGSWMDIVDDLCILDVGCGSGLLCLMAAQKNSSAKILGIDINKKAVELSRYNYKLSGFSNTTEFIHQDIIQWRSSKVFDHIICNPPYFENLSPSKESGIKIARHSSSYFLDRLMLWIDQHLAEGGKCSLVLPAQKRPQLNSILLSRDLDIFRQLDVQHNKDKAVSLQAIELRRKSAVASNNEGVKREGMVLYKDKNEKTSRYQSLCSEFYL